MTISAITPMAASVSTCMPRPRHRRRRAEEAAALRQRHGLQADVAEIG
jgi:hypothetical protein